MKYFILNILLMVLLCEETVSFLANSGVLDFNLFRCILRKSYSCPHEDITYHMYTQVRPRGKLIDVRYPSTFHLAGFNSHQETAIIIHGFNGTEGSTPIRYLRDAYVSRNFNVITVDWQRLTYYPCYLTALQNTKLVAQCTAQIFAFLTHKGSNNKQITCIGHSLGAHICGMMKNHLSSKQHKIIGLDPARPLIENHASRSYRLTRDDANIVQVIHTNAGGLGQQSLSGSVDFCINGGKMQPYCRGHPVRRSRCSHFLSICYVANAIFKNKQFLGVPCPKGCIKLSQNHLPIYNKNPSESSSLLRYMHIGQDTPEDQFGAFCVNAEFAQHCPFN